MHLQMLLPHEVFIDVEAIQYLSVEAINGSYGIQPKRLDCVAALEPSILSYTTASDDIVYVAIDTGILVKVGDKVTVSVRQAKKGVDLDQLYAAIKTEFFIRDEQEREIHSSLAKLESGLIRCMTGLKG